MSEIVLIAVVPHLVGAWVLLFIYAAKIDRLERRIFKLENSHDHPSR